MKAVDHQRHHDRRAVAEPRAMNDEAVCRVRPRRWSPAEVRPGDVLRGGSTLWLVEGFHRIASQGRRRSSPIGRGVPARHTFRYEAWVYCSTNDKHRVRKDQRTSARWCFAGRQRWELGEWRARIAALSHAFVNKVRASWNARSLERFHIAQRHLKFVIASNSPPPAKPTVRGTAVASVAGVLSPRRRLLIGDDRGPSILPKPLCAGTDNESVGRMS